MMGMSQEFHELYAQASQIDNILAAYIEEYGSDLLDELMGDVIEGEVIDEELERLTDEELGVYPPTQDEEE